MPVNNGEWHIQWRYNCQNLVDELIDVSLFIIEVLYNVCLFVCLFTGHSWGAPHDPEECAPSPSNGGKYLMYWAAVSGFDSNNFVRWFAHFETVDMYTDIFRSKSKLDSV